MKINWYIVLFVVFLAMGAELKAHGCDVNEDGLCNAGDVLVLQRIVLGIEPVIQPPSGIPQPPTVNTLTDTLYWSSVENCDTWRWTVEVDFGGGNWGFVSIANNLTYADVGCATDTSCQDQYQPVFGGSVRDYRGRVACTWAEGDWWSGYATWSE